MSRTTTISDVRRKKMSHEEERGDFPLPAASKPQPLPEFKLYRPRSGHPDWLRIAKEAHSLALEIRESAEKPRQGWSAWQRRLYSYKTTLENYVINRKLVKSGRDDLRPLYFIWTLLRTCNFCCTYCDDHQGKKYPELPNDGVLNTEQGIQLLKIMRTRTPSLYFAGGEPTIRQDLPQLTRAARDLRYFPIIINTNGSLLHRWLTRSSWKTWLADMDIIIVSLDALDLATLNKMWVYRKSEDVVRNLLMLRELSQEFNFKLMVNTVIQPGLIHEAKAVLDFANDMNIWFCPVPQNIGSTINHSLQSNTQYLKLAKIILQRKEKGYKIAGSLRMNRRLLYSEKKDCRNTVKPHIDYDGHLVWPCKASLNVKPEYINVLDFKSVDDIYAFANRKISATGFHGPAKNQCGADCNWAQNYTTDTYYHGLQHPTHILKDIKNFLSR